MWAAVIGKSPSRWSPEGRCPTPPAILSGGGRGGHLKLGYLETWGKLLAIVLYVVYISQISFHISWQECL